MNMDPPVPRWRKSSYSNAHGNCVEVAAHGASVEAPARMIAVRDSKNPDGSKLVFTHATWQAFTSQVKQDRP